MTNGIKVDSLAALSSFDTLTGLAGNTYGRVPLETVASVVGSRVGPTYETLAELDADLAHPAGAVGTVWNDGTEANNGTYKKTGSAGSGSWTRVGDAPLGTALSVANDKAAAASSSAAAASASATAASTQAEAAQLAAEASGDVLFYDTKADATAALGGLSEGQVAHVFADEDNMARATAYRVESAALNLKRYLDDPFVTMERLGGKADRTLDNSAIVNQAVIDWGLSGLFIVLATDSGDTVDTNWKNSANQYLFQNKVEIPAEARFGFRGLGFNVIEHKPQAVGDALFEIQAGSSDHGGFWFENFQANMLTDAGRLVATVPTGVGRFRRFVARGLDIKGSNYQFDMVTGYTYDPVIEEVILGGSGSGFRWVGDGVTHTTSNGTINNLHVTQSTNGRLRGPMLHLEGWQGLSGRGNILEGSTVMREAADFAFTSVGGHSVSALYLENSAGFRQTDFGGHLELSQLDTPPDPGNHGGSADYQIFVHNWATGSNQDINTRLTGGFEVVRPKYLRVENNSANSMGVVTLAGGTIDESVKDMDVVGPAEVIFENPTGQAGAYDQMALNPKARIQGRLHIKSSETNTEVSRLPMPSLMVYDYTGGNISNPQYPIDKKDGTTGELPVRYVQNDPYVGPTMIMDLTSGSNMDLQMNRLPVPLNGELINYFIRCRLTKAASLPSSGITTQFAYLGGAGNGRGYGITPNANQLSPDEWTTIQSQTRTRPEYPEDYTGLGFPRPRDVGGWLQVCSMSVGFGRGEHVARAAQASRNFRCYEDPYYNPGNAFTPAHGTVVAGDRVDSLGYSSDYIDHWICTADGTSRAISATCTGDGTASITAIDDVTELVPGDFVTVDGTSRRVMSVDYAAATAVLDGNAGTGTGLAIANDDPTWEAYWNGKVQTGSGSPVSSVTPVAIGQVYQDTAGPTIYQATGLTDADWVALN